MDKYLDTMGEILKGIFEYLKSFLFWLQGLWEEDDRQRREQAEIRRKQEQNMYIYNTMLNIATELAQVFRGRSYPFLMPIKHPADIRIKNYQTTKQGSVIFAFAVFKGTDIRMSDSDLKQQQEMFNADIERFLFEHSYNSSGMIYEEFPCICQGLRIMGAKNSPRYDRELLIYVMVRGW